MHGRDNASILSSKSLGYSYDPGIDSSLHGA